MAEDVNIQEPVVLIRVPKAFRPGMSAEALYEATRGAATSLDNALQDPGVRGHNRQGATRIRRLSCA